jgi:hypothetical protein
VLLIAPLPHPNVMGVGLASELADVQPQLHPARSYP